MKRPISVPIVTLIGLSLTLAACSQTSLPHTTPKTQAPSASVDTAAEGAYLVGFSENLSAQSLNAQALEAQAIAAAGGILKSQFADIHAAAVQLTPQALAKLQANPLIVYVEPDLQRRALGFRSGQSVNAAPASQTLAAQALTTQALYAPSGEYTWGDAALKVANLRASNYTGAGAAVCIGDTGIDGNHPEFQRRLKGFKNFTPDLNRNDPYSLNDVSHHGTHVSGTIFAQYGAGTGAGGLQPSEDANGVGGVASGVNLYMARVLGDDGSGSSSGIINGVNWCVSQLKSQGGSESKVVISLSLGGGRASQTEQRAYTSAYNKGALIVAASGNDGSTKVSYPAAYNNVVAVGAIDDSNVKASFSNAGTALDLVGPGVGVLSSVPLGQGASASASAVNVPAFTSVTGADKSAKATASAGIVAAGGSNNEFCGVGFSNPALSSKIALISRGTCTFEEKVANAARSGAAGVMIYNNAAGPLGLSLTNPYAIPVVGLIQGDGQATLGQLPTSGTVSVGSADYEYFDGTSMATPHVSAAAAVVWAAKPALTNTQLVSLLTSTATDLGTAGRDDNYGYGLVNPQKAITGN